MQWLQIARTQLTQTPGLPSLWRLAAKQLKEKGAQKWYCVRGPMGATIATLMDAGWHPEEWNMWLDSHGVSWRLAEESTTTPNMKTCDAMLRSLRRDLQVQLWASSSSNEFLKDKLLITKGIRSAWLKLHRQEADGATVLLRVFAGGL